MEIQLSDFDYTLPQERIAIKPVEPKDHAKLLVYKNGIIKDTYFYLLADELPENSILIVNNTKVIPARLWFEKPDSQCIIEVFCLNPIGIDIQQAMERTASATWECMIGNKKRWKKGQLKQQFGDIELSVTCVKSFQNTFAVEFNWRPENYTFAQVLESAGKMPLPPYIARDADEEDKKNYQTIFAQEIGAVAAPTAGLHFTERVLNSLKNKGINLQTVTLHVGAGTFMPIKTNNPLNHSMHYEKISVSYDVLYSLYENFEQVPFIAVGTTTLRTLESMYWLGVRLLERKPITLPYLIEKQDISWTYPVKYTFKQSLEAVLSWLDALNSKHIEGYTNLYIVPYTPIQSINAIITNFHQPKSTLLMLISAIVGQNWKDIYTHALQNGYRFLSYGDANLYWKE
ncbi:MAG: S-adenosylmethionine:tRNA ribosyltransferase-isomerase [Bacteroidia bacterium]|nr:S-adenosylmethionine:tRNA ribosyltransferase-isomerase [Bacteroidia bacterium]MDW8301132.1 S-adenosylmethionine:tRNA ribosyltransferase-isomerase [Bacteroidia bacterium]